MKTKLVTYFEDDKTFHADTCLPLVNAHKTGLIEFHALARSSYPGNRLKNSELPGLCTVGYWDAKGQQNWGLEYHRNEGIEFTFMETGQNTFMVENDLFELKPDDLTITRPWQPHKVGHPNIESGILHWIIIDVRVRRPNENWKWPKWVMLTKNDLDELTTLLRLNEKPVWHNVNQNIKKCFQQLAQAVSQNNQKYNISKICIYINEILLLMLEMFRYRNLNLDNSLISSSRTVDLFLRRLISSKTELTKNWTVEDMANQCGLGVTAFIHHCKQITNMTPIQYLIYVRIEMAVKLLSQNSGLTITEIAFDCGFCTSQYFATMFKKVKGVSPKEFRHKK